MHVLRRLPLASDFNGSTEDTIRQLVQVASKGNTSHLSRT